MQNILERLALLLISLISALYPVFCQFPNLSTDFDYYTATNSIMNIRLLL